MGGFQACVCVTGARLGTSADHWELHFFMSHVNSTEWLAAYLQAADFNQTVIVKRVQ